MRKHVANRLGQDIWLEFAAAGVYRLSLLDSGRLRLVVAAAAAAGAVVLERRVQRFGGCRLEAFALLGFLKITLFSL